MLLNFPRKIFILAAEMKKGFASILAQERERLSRKAALKLPTLASGLEIPSALALEQCSSEVTAAYKAEVARRWRADNRRAEFAPERLFPNYFGAKKQLRPERGTAIADLTGGLGIDCLAFAKRFERVLYNEMNPALGEAAARNFAALGAGNIRCCTFEIQSGQAPWKEAVAAFAPDLLYLDPARRNASGAKVFRLQDCSPDIAALLPDLEKICPRLLLKLSPMADISVLLAWAEGRVQELHIVEKDGECKELLLLMDASRRREDPLIRVVVPETGASLDFRPSEERSAARELASGDFPLLFEPGPALMKAGAFKGLCGRYPLAALSPSVHLYASDEVIEPLSPFGKWYRVTETLPFGKDGFKTAGMRFGQAEVSARGIPMRSEELRRRCGCTGGGDEHLFGVQTLSGRRIIAASRLPQDVAASREGKR